MRALTTTELGRYGEELAVKHLKKKGYKILERNYRVGHNEIDIIAEDKEYKIFVEVKTRSGGELYGYNYGIPSEAVDIGKQRRTISAAEAYLYKNEGDGEYEKMIRFDIIEVYLKKSAFTNAPVLLKLEHMEDAFRA